MPCIVQLALLWFSALTGTNADLVIERRTLETFGRVAAVTLETAFKIPMSKMFSPRRIVLSAQGLVAAVNPWIGARLGNRRTT